MHIVIPSRATIQIVSTKGDSDPEGKDTRSKKDEVHKYKIEAAIVRIMKASKCMEVYDYINILKLQFSLTIYLWTKIKFKIELNIFCDIF